MCIFLTGDEAKAMWIKLRDAYRSSVKRLKTSTRIGDPAVSVKPWKYSQQMDFLKPYMKDRPRHTNECGEGREANKPNIADNIENLSNDVADNNALGNSAEGMSETAAESQRNVKKRKKCDPTMNFLVQQAKTREERSNERDGWRRDILQPPDGLKLVFDSMYAATKELAPDLQKVVKRKLFSVVSIAEDAMENRSQLYFALNHQASCTSASSSVD
ncbi:hypothetical protein PR048_002186 [Dryococelus australis]|uniref:MADF domain-containing protein n=1 Tax=Dryococelus australis TaxID=614101 RepID=A0ABQ9IJG6_9NEOP|nr:hypothetical protein PR048_002186 [Dryococelus australis]